MTGHEGGPELCTGPRGGTLTDRLFEIGAEQLARETARSIQALADNRRQRHRTILVILLAVAMWCVGIFLLGLAGHVRSVDTGAMLFWAGLAIGNAGPMYAGLWYWSHTAD